MALSEKAKNKRDKLSPFGQWLDDRAVSQGTSLQEIARYIGQEYALIARFSVGTKTPTYDMAQQIGEMVDDAHGALLAAGYEPPSSPASAAPLPAAPAPVSLPRTLATGDTITLIATDPDPDNTARQVEAFLVALRAARK